jgi:hypothetical protein
VCTNEVEHRLEKLEVGDGGGSKLWVREEGESEPAVSLHGEQATMCESQDVAGVSMDVQGGAGPGLEGQEDSAQFGYIVREGWAY